MDKYSYISNAHGAYIEDLYKDYRENPESVDESWRLFFDGFDFSQQKFNGNDTAAGAGELDAGTLHKEVAVRKLIDAYRLRGHLQAKTNPVRERVDRQARLELSDFGLEEADLDRTFFAGQEIGIGQATLRDIVSSLKKIYEGAIGFEFMGIREPEVYDWFQNKVEKEYLNFKPSGAEKNRILTKLTEAVVFENFLHKKYIGQKRFSLEGGESTIPALDAIINTAADLGVQEVMIGMAHRGRLNVLANTLRKTYDQIFEEFEGKALLDETMGDGDVKYHMGYSSQIDTVSGKKVHVRLAPNPSHLEAVDPVVQGFIRAKVDHSYENDATKALPILIHGDAAIAGQGLVYEVAQMSKLDAYDVGGTIHFVINNQVGFTTDFEDARSSIYCTDVSQLVEAPEIHVNGDDPEAVFFAVKTAVEFRQKFNRDIYIDMVCYRKHGHNESDEPKFTQPKLYNIISKHKNPRELYVSKLLSAGEITKDRADQIDREFKNMLQQRLDNVRQKELPYVCQSLEEEWQLLRKSFPEDFHESPDTAISEDAVNQVAKALTTFPEGFKPLRQVSKLFKNRTKQFFEDKVLDWASGELLAYGSILHENKVVRMSGQDVERGTFSHRHAIITDSETNEQHCNLNHINDAQGELMIYNSLLSEYGVLGFEFGYSMANPQALVIWEAQFGDFANGAQVMIDQFVTSCESKWQRMNGIVMLLPHGYEGQGPEHSNARPERFLQLSSEYNIVVANVTTPANFFHLMRRQLAWEFRKPCVVMSPKSLLRHPKCVSPVSDFTEGRFQEVIDDLSIENPRRILFCSGKIYYDLLEYREANNISDVAVIRVEQLHPFPKKQIDALLDKYKDIEGYWVQEEPENMGAWHYVLGMMYHFGYKWKVVSRKSSASPATGFGAQHKAEHEKIMLKAFAK